MSHDLKAYYGATYDIIGMIDLLIKRRPVGFRSPITDAVSARVADDVASPDDGARDARRTAAI